MIKILNLSDIIDNDTNSSVAAFSDLSKQSGVTPLDCGGFLTGAWRTGSSSIKATGMLSEQHWNTISTLPIRAVLTYYTYYNSTIQDYKLGKVTTNNFINDCLNFVFKCPEGTNISVWKGKLISAWNAMIKVNEDKLNDFLTYVQASNDQFILITNSNDLHVQYVLEKVENEFSVAEGFDDVNANSNQPLIISSHKVGTFKTDDMIQNIKNKFQDQKIEVFTKYQGDIKYCEEKGLACTFIDSNFNYETFMNDGIKLKHD